MLNFWNARKQWLPSWRRDSGSKTAFVIDYVKVWALWINWHTCIILRFFIVFTLSFFIICITCSGRPVSDLFSYNDYVVRVGIQYCREHEEVSRQQKSANRLPSDSIIAKDYNIAPNVIALRISTETHKVLFTRVTQLVSCNWTPSVSVKGWTMLPWNQ